MRRVIIEFFRDLRFGARLLRRSAGFTFIAVLSLGLGIGGATAVRICLRTGRRGSSLWSRWADKALQGLRLAPLFADRQAA